MCFKSWKFWKRGQREREKSSAPLSPHIATAILDHRPPISGASQSLTPAEIYSPATASGIALDVSTTSSVSPSSSAPATTAQNAQAAQITSVTPDNRAQKLYPSIQLSEPSPEPCQSSEADSPPGLWSRAYNELKAQEPQVVDAYERLLTVELSDKGPLVSEETENCFGDSAEDRERKMKELLEKGLKKTESSTAVYTRIEDGIHSVTPFKGLIETAMKASSEAAVVWVGVTFAIEILQNPFTEPGLNRAGITHVVSMMRWYCALANLLLDTGSISEAQRPLQEQIEDGILKLYEQLLLYQMKSICRYFRSRFVSFLKDAVKLDDWQGKLDYIKSEEAKLMQYIQSYDNQSILTQLQSLSSTAESQRTSLEEAVSLIQIHIRNQHEQTRTKENKKCLQDLYSTNPSDDRERIMNAKGGLLRDSYRWIMENHDFLSWQTNPSKRRLWISGDPGKGKTMLICGIIEELKKDPYKRLCYFFCQATLEMLNSAEAVLRGLIYHLAIQFPWLLTYVTTEYAKKGREAFNGHNSWQIMSSILKEMLSDPDLNEVLFLVDGLDECVAGQYKLLSLIAELSNNHRVKLIVASRGEPFWKQDLDESAESITLSLELNGDRIADAVRAYIDQKVRDLAKYDPYKDSETQTQVRDYLIENSTDTFLWVALVCKALGQRRTIWLREQVKTYLEQFPSGLDRLYEQMFNKVVEFHNPDGIVEPIEEAAKKRCLDILAITSVLQRPSTIMELLVLLEPTYDHDPKSLEKAIYFCGCFLHIQNGFVYFVHQSAKEFLQDQNKASFNAIFPQKIEGAHQDVYSRSLKFMTKALKRNIYDLEGPGVLKKDITPPQTDPLASLGYSCLHWAYHVRESEQPVETATTNGDRVHEFLKEKFLHWIEAMVIMNSMREAIQAVQLLQTTYQAEQGLSEFIHDANRFLLCHRRLIENAPLQLYASALLFSPKRSLVREQFWCQAPEWVTVIADTGETWGMDLHTLEGHRDRIWSVAYSPDGRWLASGSQDGTLKIWNADSGDCLHTIEGHGEVEDDYHRPEHPTRPAAILAVAFSADSQSFLSVSEKAVVKLWEWDFATCNCVREFEINPGKIKANDVSTDGLTIAFGPPDGIVRLWDTKGNLLDHKFKNKVECDVEYDDFPVTTHSALAVYGQSLAAAPREWESEPTDDSEPVDEPEPSNDAIKIWNTLTGKMARILRIGATVSFDTVLRWSTDGQWLAVGTGRFPTVDFADVGKIQIWARETGKLVTELRVELPSGGINDKSVKSIAFSPDRKLLAAGIGGRLFVWDISTSMNSLLWSYENHGGWALENILTISFRPDSRRLVTAGGGNMKVWDLSSGMGNAHHTPTDQVYFSDELHFATYQSSIGEIKFWDLTIAKDVLPVTFQQPGASAIALSQDNQRLASSSPIGEIAIWSTKTGDLKKRFGCFIGGRLEDDIPEHQKVKSLAFLGNDQLATSRGGIIDILKISDGTVQQTFNNLDQFIRLITVSKDGRWLAYVSGAYKWGNQDAHEDVVKFLDTTTGRCTSTASQTKPWGSNSRGTVASLSFSADSQLLASSIYDHIRLYDVSEGTCIRSFKYNRLTAPLLASFDSGLGIEARLHTQYGFLNGDLEPEPPSPTSGSEGDPHKMMTFEWLKKSLGFGDPLPLHGYGFSCRHNHPGEHKHDRGLDWILRNGKRLLQIPVDFTASEYSTERMTPVINGSTIMWASFTGRVVRMHFAAQDDSSE